MVSGNINELNYTPYIETIIEVFKDFSKTLKQSVINIEEENLDTSFSKDLVTIGALLMHITAIEKYYQIYTFQSRKLNPNEMKIWENALDLNSEVYEVCSGKNTSFYITEYLKVKNMTLDLFSTVDDEWLLKKTCL